MAVTTYLYNTGSATGWTNPSYSWDNNASTRAIRAIPQNSSFDDEVGYKITGTANTAPSSGGAISKVEIGITAQASNSIHLKLRLQPFFDGLNGDYHDTGYLTTSDVTTWFTVSNDINAPGIWGWSDVQTLDISAWGSNDDINEPDEIRINQFYVRVTYGWLGTINGVYHPVKVNGILTGSIKSINGIE